MSQNSKSDLFLWTEGVLNTKSKSYEVVVRLKKESQKKT